jgi:hypothetical protein
MSASRKSCAITGLQNRTLTHTYVHAVACENVQASDSSRLSGSAQGGQAVLGHASKAASAKTGKKFQRQRPLVPDHAAEERGRTFTISDCLARAFTISDCLALDLRDPARGAHCDGCAAPSAVPGEAGARLSSDCPIVRSR